LNLPVMQARMITPGMSCRKTPQQRQKKTEEVNGARNGRASSLFNRTLTDLIVSPSQKAKQAAIKAKREHQKEMKALAKAKQKEKAAEAKAAAAAASSVSDSPEKSPVEEPAKKKQKLDQDGKSKRKQHQPPPSISEGPRQKGFSNKGDHKRGKLAGKDKSKPKGERKQKRHGGGGGNSVLKIFD
jgi:hypothetical protein